MGRTLISTPRQASMTTTTQGLRSAHHGMLICSLIVGVSFPAVGMMHERSQPHIITAG